MVVVEGCACMCVCVWEGGEISDKREQASTRKKQSHRRVAALEHVREKGGLEVVHRQHAARLFCVVLMVCVCVCVWRERVRD